MVTSQVSSPIWMVQESVKALMVPETTLTVTESSFSSVCELPPE